MQDAKHFDTAAGNHSIEDEVITETGDGEVSQIRLERLMRFVARAYAWHGGQTGEGRFGFGERSANRRLASRA